MEVSFNMDTCLPYEYLNNNARFCTFTLIDFFIKIFFNLLGLAKRNRSLEEEESGIFPTTLPYLTLPYATLQSKVKTLGIRMARHLPLPQWLRSPYPSIYTEYLQLLYYFIIHLKPTTIPCQLLFFLMNLVVFTV